MITSVLQSFTVATEVITSAFFLLDKGLKTSIVRHRHPEVTIYIHDYDYFLGKVKALHTIYIPNT